MLPSPPPCCSMLVQLSCTCRRCCTGRGQLVKLLFLSCLRSAVPPSPPARRYDFFSGQEAVLGAHEAGVKCVEWLPTRGLLATAGWDRCGALGKQEGACCWCWAEAGRWRLVAVRQAMQAHGSSSSSSSSSTVSSSIGT